MMKPYNRTKAQLSKAINQLVFVDTTILKLTDSLLKKNELKDDVQTINNLLSYVMERDTIRLRVASLNKRTIVEEIK